MRNLVIEVVKKLQKYLRVNLFVQLFSFFLFQKHCFATKKELQSEQKSHTRNFFSNS